MPIYEFRCDDGHMTSRLQPVDKRTLTTDCSYCGMNAKRIFSLRAQPVIHEHYNPAVGTTVTGHKDFANKLKEKSERVSAELGMEHNFVPVDYSDTKSLGVTSAGLDETARRGKVPVRFPKGE